MLEHYLQAGQRVLDLGAGSGILAIVAAKFGAASVFALDIADAAVQQARENIAFNGVQQIVWVEQGSLDTALQAMASGQASAADLVVANILAPILVKLPETRSYSLSCSPCWHSSGQYTSYTPV
jgi:ribosomal protein L11 methyltransferase